MAVWDAVAKALDRPLCVVLNDRFGEGPLRQEVYVYAAGGYYAPDKGLSQLQDEVKRYLDMGFESAKIKVGGVPLAEDLQRIEAATSILGSPSRLAVDANGCFAISEAISFAQAIEPYGLKWFEEPVDPHDFLGHAAVAASYSGTIATGENLFAAVEVNNLARHGGLNPSRDLLQFDPVLSYGICEYVDTLALIERLGWGPSRCIPHGGHQLSLHLAAALGLYGNEAYPGVFLPFGEFSDGVEPVDGYVRVPDDSGLGLERITPLYSVLRELT